MDNQIFSTHSIVGIFRLILGLGSWQPLVAVPLAGIPCLHSCLATALPQVKERAAQLRSFSRAELEAMASDLNF